MLVAGRTGVDRSRRRAACPRHAQRRRIQGAVGALRRCEDLRNHPALRLLSDRVVFRERARSAAGGKSSEVSEVIVIARSVCDEAIHSFFSAPPTHRAESSLLSNSSKAAAIFLRCRTVCAEPLGPLNLMATRSGFSA